MKKNFKYMAGVIGMTALITGCTSTVTFVPGNGGAIVGENPQSIGKGDSTSPVYAKPHEGYYFDKWNDSHAYTNPTANPLIIRNVTEDRMVTAQFVPTRTTKTITSVPQQVQGFTQQSNTAPPQQQVSAKSSDNRHVPAVLQNQEVKPPKPLRYFTSTTPVRIKLQVVRPSNYKFTSISRKIEGAIANSGYEVISDTISTGRRANPYLSILVNGKLGQFDKFGNYYVYKGKAELTVKRNIQTTQALKTVLARETISAKGSRALGQDEAIESLISKLADKSADYVTHICSRELQGITSVTATLRKEALRKVFGRNLGSEQNVINGILQRASKIDGILSIRQVGVDLNSFTIEVIYRKSAFPSGVIHDYIDGNVQVSNADPVGDFMRYLFKIGGI